MSLRQLARTMVMGGLGVGGADALARARQRRRMRWQQTALVRVAMLHASSAAHADAFRRQLLWVKQNFNLIDFAGLKRLWQERRPKPDENARPYVLFTFDDGLASNYEIAAPLLEELGTRGVFFVVPEFSRRSGEDAKQFFNERIHGPIDRGWQPMSRQQVRELSDRGHTIGNHTLTHARLSETALDQYAREIGQSADILEEWTGKPIETFAWTFYYNAITPETHRMVCQRHPFCFSPCPGLNDLALDTPKLIWRTNVEPPYSAAEYRFMYSGLADRVWAARRAALAKMLQP